uniref:Pentacotripeptide-repeat region of PRORP domain-containing protein n=1 Tax=Amorphochlora amoebiformis TaxID=1561963 RepID=A0A7S0H765_9EUKA
MRDQTLMKSGPDCKKSFRRMVHNTYLKACAEACAPKAAEAGFRDMVESGVTPNKKTHGKIVQALSMSGDLSSAVEWTRRHGAVGTAIWNIIIAGYAKAGDSEKAEAIFTELDNPDKFSYTNVMAAWAARGDPSRTTYWFERMRTEIGEAIVDTVHFGMLAKSWMELPSKGWHAQVIRLSKDLEARAEADGKRDQQEFYRRVIQRLIHHQEFVSAAEFLNRMRVKLKDGQKIDYREFISAAMKAGNTKFARELFAGMILIDGREPEEDIFFLFLEHAMGWRPSITKTDPSLVAEVIHCLNIIGTTNHVYSASLKDVICVQAVVGRFSSCDVKEIISFFERSEDAQNFVSNLTTLIDTLIQAHRTSDLSEVTQVFVPSLEAILASHMFEDFASILERVYSAWMKRDSSSASDPQGLKCVKVLRVLLKLGIKNPHWGHHKKRLLSYVISTRDPELIKFVQETQVDVQNTSDFCWLVANLNRNKWDPGDAFNFLRALSQSKLTGYQEKELYIQIFHKISGRLAIEPHHVCQWMEEILAHAVREGSQQSAREILRYLVRLKKYTSALRVFNTAYPWRPGQSKSLLAYKGRFFDLVLQQSLKDGDAEAVAHSLQGRGRNKRDTLKKAISKYPDLDWMAVSRLLEYLQPGQRAVFDILIWGIENLQEVDDIMQTIYVVEIITQDMQKAMIQACLTAQRDDLASVLAQKALQDVDVSDNETLELISRALLSSKSN